MDCMVHGVTKSWTPLRDFTISYHTVAIECVYVYICCYYFDVFLFQFESQTAGALSLPHFDLQHLAQCLAKPGIKNMY